MRLLFLFVLLVNALFIGWELSQPDDESSLNNGDSLVPSIELLSESGRATKVVAEKPAGVPAKAEQGKRDEKPTKSASSAKKPSRSAAVPSNAETCFTLGPFRKLDKLREFTRGIKDYVVTASFRSRQEQEQSLFWVYLEPESSALKAKILGKQLKDQKIKDYYVITSGDKKNGVSLGHFKEKDRAKAHAESVKELGFNPMIETVFRSYTIYWLDYQVAAGAVIPQKTFTKHLTKKINLLDRVCS